MINHVQHRHAAISRRDALHRSDFRAGKRRDKKITFLKDATKITRKRSPGKSASALSNRISRQWTNQRIHCQINLARLLSKRHRAAPSFGRIYSDTQWTLTRRYFHRRSWKSDALSVQFMISHKVISPSSWK